jgi:hypothetical protein
MDTPHDLLVRCCSQAGCSTVDWLDPTISRLGFPLPVVPDTRLVGIVDLVFPLLVILICCPLSRLFRLLIVIWWAVARLFPFDCSLLLLPVVGHRMVYHTPLRGLLAANRFDCVGWLLICLIC